MYQRPIQSVNSFKSYRANKLKSDRRRHIQTDGHIHENHFFGFRGSQNVDIWQKRGGVTFCINLLWWECNILFSVLESSGVPDELHISKISSLDEIISSESNEINPSESNDNSFMVATIILSLIIAVAIVAFVVFIVRYRKVHMICLLYVQFNFYAVSCTSEKTSI